MLAFPTGRLGSRRQRLVAGAGYLAVFVLTPVAVLFKDARTDVFPRQNVLLLDGDPAIFHLLDLAYLATGAVVAVAVLAVLVRRWVAAGPPLRRILAPVFGAGLLGTAGSVAAGLFGPLSPWRETLAWLPRIAFCLLPLGFLAGVWRVRLGRTAVGTLLARLRTPLPADGVRDALAQAVGDPSLRVGYWRPDAEAFVDGDGRPLAVPADDVGVTLVAPGGRRIAVLLHDPALHEDRHVLDAVTAAAELALDNQRLTAEVRAQLADTRDLAGRLVTAADAERRRLERDLHDGAQQRLVCAAMALRQSVHLLESEDRVAAAAALRASLTEVEAVLGELREVANGLHPAILTDAGLVQALAALTERVPEPDVVLYAPDLPTLPATVEATGYFVAAEALTNALKHATASHISLSLGYSQGELTLVVVDDGVGGADVRGGSGLRGLRDRVTALGGTIALRSPPGGGTTLTAVIPAPVDSRR